jgi:hypothetical protein
MSHYHSTVHKSPLLSNPVPHQHVKLPKYRPQIPTNQYPCTVPTCHITAEPSTNNNQSVPLYQTNMSHHRSTVHKSPPLSKPVPQQHVTSPQYRPQIPTTRYTCTTPTCHITIVRYTNPQHSVTLYHTNMSHYNITVHKSTPLRNLYRNNMSHHRSTVHKSPPLGTPVQHQHDTYHSTVHKSPPLRKPGPQQPVTSPQYRRQIPTTRYPCTTPTCHITTIPSTNPHQSVHLYHTNKSHYHSTAHKSPPLSTPVPQQHVILIKYRPQIPTTQYPCSTPTCHITTVPSTNPHHSVQLYCTNMSHYKSTVHKSPPLGRPVTHHVTSPQ